MLSPLTPKRTCHRIQKRFISNLKEHFYVARYDFGHKEKLPTWANKSEVIDFDPKYNTKDINLNIVSKNDGIFQLSNVLTNNECDQFINITEKLLGYTTDAPVSLPYSVRHMSNCNWVVQDNIAYGIFSKTSKKS